MVAVALQIVCERVPTASGEAEMHPALLSSSDGEQ